MKITIEKGDITVTVDGTPEICSIIAEQTFYFVGVASWNLDTKKDEKIKDMPKEVKKVLDKSPRAIIEVKTCNKIIKKSRPELGRFKFNTDKRYPYRISQHHDLVKDEGWYIFVVASGNQHSEYFGIASKEIILPEEKAEHRIVWCKILNQCHPDWMRRLKLQVYGI